jgi:hypothetical protein
MSIETDKVGATEETKATPETGPAPDSEAAVLQKVMTIESAFNMKAPSLKSLYLSFGEYAREKLDPSDSGRTYVTLGHLAFQILAEEHRLNPGGFKRSTVSENIKNAGRYAGVPESRNLPHEFTSAYWLARLDQSTPGETGMPRTWGPDQISENWFGGNLTYAALRLLFPTMFQVDASDTELETREFKPGWEAWVREIVKRLRSAQLTCGQVKALYDTKKTAIQKEEERARHKVMTPEQIKDEKRLAKLKTQEKKLQSLGSDALSLAENASDAGITSKEALTDFLVNKGVVDRPQSKTVYDWADTMTAGDARALIQRLDEKGRADIVVCLWLHLKQLAILGDVANLSHAASKPTLRATGTDD